MRKLLTLLAAIIWLITISGTPLGQDRELINKDHFIKELGKSETDKQDSKLRLRSISVEHKKPPEVTVHILFKFGTVELADVFSKRQLQEAGEALSSDTLSKYRFEIAGHTDNIGSDDFNQGLSEQRARAIKRFLCENYGIEGNRLVAKGYGKSMPVASNETEEGRAKNRRVVFKRID